MKPTRKQRREWEARLEIGWPTDPEALREWQEEGIEPELTLDTLEVLSPPSQIITRLEHYAARSKRAIPDLETMLSTWQRNKPVPAVSVCIAADALIRHDNGAADWLGEMLWELLEWSTWPLREQLRARRDIKRELVSQTRKRTWAVKQIEKATEAFLEALRTDWRTLEPDDYLDSLNQWRQDWLAF